MKPALALFLFWAALAATAFASNAYALSTQILVNQVISSEEFYTITRAANTTVTFLPIRTGSHKTGIFESLESPDQAENYLELLGFPREPVHSAFYLWGNLVDSWTQIQMDLARIRITVLQAAGWKVTVDTHVTYEKAQNYFADPQNEATFWSSHGTETGVVTTYDEVSGFNFFPPASIRVENPKLKLVVLCACNAGKLGRQYSAQLGGAVVLGPMKPITVGECATESDQGMAKKIATYFN